ncbi:cellulase [Hymenobacter sp. UV11]|uniref:glycoside hydrolase family 9 protein n=1 Tax=Hymenobacter sp. UV11 TaxID=1849735 RepID=UPI001060AE63|nr:glycoside hydrolase family 9 protein [Hymenobacter sp. UV11]TDN38877.1 cellulase [Hymenobacter sp. UV11]TFZ63867.1 cellulase [Hymenobacter sp. UV11]
MSTYFKYFSLLLALPLHAQTVIHLDQVGFYPTAPKVAVLVGAPAGRFELKTADLTKTVFTGELGPTQTYALAAQQTRVADFSAFQGTGTFVLTVPGQGQSAPFRIQPNVHEGVAKAALRGYYYQRASTALLPAQAGPWARPAGHPDTQVLVHPSAASPARPAGTVISAPRGWYDAGDYNKYVVNSGITMGTLFALYEDFPAYSDQLQLHIPESQNRLPDLLDEALWNLRWLLAMQDPHDGGVYHKLTNASFAGMVMPAAAQAPRYVVQKSTAATLDFAAVTAQASRIFRKFDKQTPGLADSCLRASQAAWTWAQAHPAVLYDQDAMNKTFQPAIATGSYGDRTVADEFIWAAAELYATTKADSYYTAVNLYPDAQTPLPDWGSVRTLAYYTLARLGNQATPLAQKDLPALRTRLLAAADQLLKGAAASPYQTVMGQAASDFQWGSNARAANQGIALVQAYRLSGNRRYLLAALGNLDYLLGRNATGYCFVTGLGSHSPQHPHHRPSEADGLAAPVPGLLAGGPNPGQQDHCTYASSLPPLSYSDSVCSYASNEIAINWNAPLVYLAGALEALQTKGGLVKGAK